MAEVDISSQATGPDSYRIYWESTDPDAIYYVCKDGILLGNTQQTYFLVSLAAGECAHINVYDDAEDVPDDGYPGTIMLFWDAVDDATAYRVERYLDGEWATAARFTATAETYYRYASPFLADGTEHQFRIVAVGVNDGTPRLVTALMVRRPDPPDVEHTYDSETGDLTVDE